MVLPGIIDCHTHFQLDTGKMQTLDDFESGSASAAAGGVTTYINFAPQQRGQSLVDAVEEERLSDRSNTTPRQGRRWLKLRRLIAGSPSVELLEVQCISSTCRRPNPCDW